MPEEILDGDILPPLIDTTLVQENSTKEYIINIDDIVQEAYRYRQAFQIMRNATERDTIRIILNTPGGYVSTAIQICSHLVKTKAATVAEVYEACSAGATIALHCDKIEIMPFGYMMIHSMSGGFSGKAADMKAHTDFIDKWNDDVMKTCYQGFLTDVEIKNIISGNELWLHKKVIDQKLKAWTPMRKRKVKAL